MSDIISSVAAVLVAISVIVVLGVGWALNLKALPSGIRWAVKGPIGNFALVAGVAGALAHLKLGLARPEGPDLLELVQVWLTAIVVVAVLAIVVGALASGCVRIAYAPAVARERARAEAAAATARARAAAAAVAETADE